jgi:hypothetical protein
MLRVCAQPDSTHLDLGYITLKKEFTQQLVISGADLEKMPFTNLSDALAAWLYGAYTRPSTLLYIVDGSPVADVNAYSVFDIEEAILVENASGMVFTGAGQQAVVLIRTRRGKERFGVNAAAQTGLLSGGTKGLKTDTRWYQQYYLGANIHTGAWRFGASANWVRDVQPISGTDRVVTPDNLQRWRFHGYADWQPDNHNLVELTAGYAPQKFGLGTDSAEQQQYTYRTRSSATQRFFLPGLRWQGEWFGGLTNELQASYVQSVYQETGMEKSAADTNSAYYQEWNSNIGRSSYHGYVRDRLAWRLASGGWRIEPAMNVSYEHINERLNYAENNSWASGPGYPPSYAASGGLAYTKYHVLFYTPQLDIRYKNAVDVVFGEMAEAGFNEFPGSHKAFFFASGSLHLLQSIKENSSSGLMFFGSYAQRTAPPLPGYQLSDLTYGYSNYDTYTANGISFTGYENMYYNIALPTQQFWVWDAGVRYSAWEGRLQIQGNVERRNYTLAAYYYLPYGGNGSTVSEIGLSARDILLHLDVRANLLQGAAADWVSSVNFTILGSKVSGVTTANQDGQLFAYTGDVHPNPYSVTGGWVNRIRVRRFIAGLDLVYHFGETYFQTGPGVFPAVSHKLNQVVVPNIYSGYRFGPAQTGTEIFVESRGLFRSSPSDLSQSRYYTFGGKFAL